MRNNFAFLFFLLLFSCFDQPIVLYDGSFLRKNTYERFDSGWFPCSLIDLFFKSFQNKISFKKQTNIINISNNVKIAMVGDFGAGTWNANNTAIKIKNSIEKIKSDFTIHLGDVYYCGTKDEVQNKFLKYWPKNAKIGNLALNGNHEMIRGGDGYFNVLLKDKLFSIQNGASYFALENDYWIIIGLDTAYYAGFLDSPEITSKNDSSQREFLFKMKAKNKPIILLTHHDSLSLDAKKNDLWYKMISILGENLKYWYAGHMHNAIVYKKIDNVNFRIAGHGVIPYGDSNFIRKNQNHYILREILLANNSKDRLKNGFVVLKLNKHQIIEEYYNEDGDISFQLKNI